MNLITWIGVMAAAGYYFGFNYLFAQLGIPPSNKLLFGLSFGYPDWNNPSNACHTDRAGVSEAVTFHA